MYNHDMDVVVLENELEDHVVKPKVVDEAAQDAKIAELQEKIDWQRNRKDDLSVINKSIPVHSSSYAEKAEEFLKTYTSMEQQYKSGDAGVTEALNGLIKSMSELKVEDSKC